MSEHDLMTVAEIAAELGIAQVTWRTKVSRGYAPKPLLRHRIPETGQPRWPRSVVESYKRTESPSRASVVPTVGSIWEDGNPPRPSDAIWEKADAIFDDPTLRRLVRVVRVEGIFALVEAYWQCGSGDEWRTIGCRSASCGLSSFGTRFMASDVVEIC